MTIRPDDHLRVIEESGISFDKKYGSCTVCSGGTNGPSRLLPQRNHPRFVEWLPHQPPARDGAYGKQ